MKEKGRIKTRRGDGGRKMGPGENGEKERGASGINKIMQGKERVKKKERGRSH